MRMRLFVLVLVSIVAGNQLIYAQEGDGVLKLRSQLLIEEGKVDANKSLVDALKILISVYEEKRNRPAIDLATELENRIHNLQSWRELLQAYLKEAELKEDREKFEASISHQVKIQEILEKELGDLTSSPQ